jgi:hypothetical protein
MSEHDFLNDFCVDQRVADAAALQAKLSAEVAAGQRAKQQLDDLNASLQSRDRDLIEEMAALGSNTNSGTSATPDSRQFSSGSDDDLIASMTALPCKGGLSHD